MSQMDPFPRPDRQRKPKTKGKSNIDPLTGKPRVNKPNPNVKPFELPSDYPGAPKPMPPVPDFVKQMEQQRTQAGLRQRLEEKKSKGRCVSEMAQWHREYRAIGV